MTTQAMSDYLENAILDHIFNNVQHTSPTSVYISLHSSAGANETTAAWQATELNAGSAINYERLQAAPSVWAAASGGQLSNSSDLTFATAGSDWGSVTHVGVWDSQNTGATPVLGNLLFYAELSAARTISNGDAARWATSNFTVIFR